MRITELLVRRTDLSTFLVHLTRASDAGGVVRSAKENLLSIIAGNQIEARSPYGAAVRSLQGARLPTDSQRCVCFTETPLEHVNLLAEDIENRTFRFEPYGIAITRKQGRTRGVNPVWYLDITPGHDWLTQPFNRLIDSAIATGTFPGSDISLLAPFIEQMGTGLGNPPAFRKEFWWEREWRHVENFGLPSTYIILCPEREFADIRARLAALPPRPWPPHISFVDPTWSLEMIIGSLAGFSHAELGPF